MGIFCYEAGSTGYGLYGLISSLAMNTWWSPCLIS
ncbi:hypothetical protein X742_30780 [Mesorhizobium sp. LNHC232B00]|nr:hypothetical protein X742_30780 [Mesorhizobium sp. LNHC232B00]